MKILYTFLFLTQLAFSQIGSFPSGTGGAPGPVGPTGPTGPTGSLPVTVIDSAYATVALACTAAGVNGAVVLTQANTAVPTQTLNCNLQAGGGTIQPASGALIRHSGVVINGDNAKIWDMSAGGHVDYSQNTKIGYITQTQFGALCDASTDDTLAFNEMFRSTIVNQATAGKPYTGVRIRGAGTCMVSNVFATLNAFPAGCYNTGTNGCYSPAFVSGEQGNKNERATVKLKGIAATTGYVFTAKSAVLTAFSNLSAEGSATEDCFNFDWPDSGPSIGNKYQGLGCTNFKGASATAAAISMKNQNDSPVDGVLVEGTSPSTANYAFSMIAPGGSCYQLSNFNIARGKPIFDCQDGVSISNYFFMGMEVGATSKNNWEFIGGQIERNPSTGCAVNSTYNAERLMFRSVSLTPSGLSTGQSVFCGGYLIGALIDGGNINFTGGNLFGTITTPQDGYNPTFEFTGTWSDTTDFPTPANPSGTSGNWVIYDGVNKPSNGTILPYLNTKDFACAGTVLRHQTYGAYLGSLNSSNNSFALSSAPFCTDYFVANDSGGSLYLKAQSGQQMTLSIGGTNVAGLGSGGFRAYTLQSDIGSNIISFSTIAPTRGVTHITGTAAIDTITLPPGVSSTVSTCLTLIADGAWSTTTAGNIFATMTAVTGTPYQACYGGSKWYIK